MPDSSMPSRNVIVANIPVQKSKSSAVGRTDGRRIAARSSFLMAQLIGWSFVGAFGLIARVVLYGDAALALAMTICTDGCAFLLTSTFHLAVTRRGAVQVTWQLIAIAVLLVIPAATLISLLGRTLLAMEGRSLPFWSEGDIGFVPFVYYAAILLGWCLAYFWISTDIGRRNRRLIRVEAELAEAHAELSHLRAQLEPQFLLGALDRISDEMANNPAGAAPLVRQAATFLHHTLESRARPISTLDAELESVRAYFAVKPTGHDVSLPIEFDVDEAARSRAIPHLVLQTLVDNAVRRSA